MLTFPCVGEADRHDYFSHLGHMLAVHFLRSKWNHLENSADSLKFHHLPLKPELGTRHYLQCVALKSKKKYQCVHAFPPYFNAHADISRVNCFRDDMIQNSGQKQELERVQEMNKKEQVQEVQYTVQENV